MKYGCIGEHLTHSFSAEIHAAFAPYEYEIRELAPELLGKFLTEGDFIGINVTIPYKQAVIPYLYGIDEVARSIGAVNTVVNRDGRLYGYNTDFFGMSELIRHADIDLSGKKVLIAGTGGTSLTAVAVARAMGAADVIRLSRSGREDAVTYEEAYRKHGDAGVLINTTPCGMYPAVEGTPVEIERLPALSGVIDAIYNPLRSELISEALGRNMKACGGLYMLVAQAVRASEIFLGCEYPADTVNTVYREIRGAKENIVLTGMPGSGKTTVGKLIAERLGRKFIDTDAEIEAAAKRTIPEIFADEGEAHFRDLEARVIDGLARQSGVVIATGGGAVLRAANVMRLKQNGRIFFLDRSPEDLIPTPDRPTASDREAILRRYRERYSIYCESADRRIQNKETAASAAEEICYEYCRH